MHFMVNCCMKMSTIMDSSNFKSLFENTNMFMDDDMTMTESEDEEKMNSLPNSMTSTAANTTMKSTSAADLIEESKALLQRHSSELNFDDGDIVIEAERKSEKRPSVAGNMVSKLNSPKPCSLPTPSILGTKHIKDGLPVIKDMKKKKAVHFNMDKNETCEIVQPELNRPTSDEESDEEESEDDYGGSRDVNNNRSSIFGHVMDAEDLVTSDNDEDEADNIYDDKNKKTNGYYNGEKDLVKDEVDDLLKEKTELLSELKHLRKRHDKEMKQLREEYQLRREDYYTELDQVQYEISEKRNELHSRKSPRSEDVSTLRDRVETEKEKLESQEKELKRKQTEAAQQEQELKEYQRYLERRHKSLNEKEEDLCILQDELEELDDILKAKRKELGDEKDKLDVKSCTHDEKQIERTRIELTDSLKREGELRDRIREKDKEIETNLDKITEVEDENSKLLSKVKHLETQFTINLKSSLAPSLADRRTSLRFMGSTVPPVDQKTGAYMSPKLSPNLSPRGLTLSPTRSLSSTDSPLHKYSTVKREDGGAHSNSPSLKFKEPSNQQPVHQDEKSIQSKTCTIM